MVFKIDLSQQGWCTPTILTALIGLFGLVVLTSQLITDRDVTTQRAKLIAIIMKAFWTIAIVALLYWLCKNGKVQASWWIFGIMYILPVIAMFIILAGVSFGCKRAEEENFRQMQENFEQEQEMMEEEMME